MKKNMMALGGVAALCLLAATVFSLTLEALSASTPIPKENSGMFALAPYVCGDVNEDGIINIGDVVYLTSYLYQGGAPPPTYAAADIDDYLVVTVNDLICLSATMCPPTCPPNNPPLSGPVDSTSTLAASRLVFQPYESSATLHFTFLTSTAFYLYSLPVKIRVEGAIPSIVDVTLTPNVDVFENKYGIIDADSGRVLFSFWNSDFMAAPPLTGIIATVTVEMTPASYPRLITVDWTPFLPEQNGYYSHYPLLLGPYPTVRTPFLFAECCEDLRGNVDGDADDNINVADISYLVSYLFQGGYVPPCLEEADVNGIDGINVSDLTYLVNYLFSGGAEPAACPQQISP